MTSSITLSAPDISCAHCVASVKEALGELPGIWSVDASETTKLIAVEFDPEQVDFSRMAVALNEAGYPATQQ